MKLTALGGANSELQAALAAEQARVEAAGAQLAAKDQVRPLGGDEPIMTRCCCVWRPSPYPTLDAPARPQELARAAQELAESQAQTEKAVEQVRLALGTRAPPREEHSLLALWFYAPLRLSS